MVHALVTPPVLALAVPLLGWGVYRRIHRNIARQPVQPRRLAARSVIVSLILIALMFWPAFDPKISAAMLAGCACGIPLAIYGLRLTQFEKTSAGWFYQPNLYMGVSISLLFIVRMAYRLILLYPLLQAGDLSALGSGARSPLTYGTLGLVLGYFATYYIGVMFTARKHSSPAPLKQA